MNTNTPLDEGWYNEKKRFVRTKKFVTIETWLLLLISTKILTLIFYLLINPIFHSFSIFDFILLAYVIWWRKITLGHDANISQKKKMDSKFHNFIFVMYLFIGIVLYFLSDVFLMFITIKSYYETQNSWFANQNFNWPLYWLAEGLTILTIIVSIYFLKETSTAETDIYAELSDKNNS